VRTRLEHRVYSATKYYLVVLIVVPKIGTTNAAPFRLTTSRYSNTLEVHRLHPMTLRRAFGADAGGLRAAL
jgi:hypothetical protein